MCLKSIITILINLHHQASTFNADILLDGEIDILHIGIQTLLHKLTLRSMPAMAEIQGEILPVVVFLDAATPAIMIITSRNTQPACNTHTGFVAIDGAWTSSRMVCEMYM